MIGTVQTLQFSPCLPTRVQFCYLLQGAYSPSGSCEVTFNWKELCANDVGIVGDPDAMKISWTAEWPVVVSSGVVSSEARTCGTLVSAGSADFLCLDGDRCDVGDSFVEPGCERIRFSAKRSREPQIWQ